MQSNSQLAQKREKLNGLIAQGQESFRKGDLESSEIYYSEALRLDPNTQEGLKGLLEIQQARTENLTAENAETSIGHSPGGTSTIGSDPVVSTDQAYEEAADLFSKGFYAEKDGDLDQAASYYRQVLNLFPDLCLLKKTIAFHRS